MTFAWPDFLTVARGLTGQSATPPAEAFHRAAIGRAYYAVFGRALQVFSARGEFRAGHTGDDHNALARWLSASSSQQYRSVGAVLDRLRPARRWADYQLGTAPRSVSIQLGSTACAQAQQALNLLDVLESAP